MQIEPVSFGKFLAGWLPALAVSSVADPAPIVAEWTVDLGGTAIPVVSAALGALGVLAARPLAVKQEAEHGWGRFALVTAILLIAIELWIIQSRPGWLFTFVVGIGLGFSGYSMIELLGDGLKGLVSSAFDQAKTKVGSVLGTKKDGNDDE